MDSLWGRENERTKVRKREKEGGSARRAARPAATARHAAARLIDDGPDWPAARREERVSRGKEREM